MLERFIAGVLLWLAVLAFLALRQRYMPSNLLTVGAGFGLTLVALAVANAAPGELLVSLSALGGALTIRGVDGERRRRAARDEEASSGAPWGVKS